MEQKGFVLHDAFDENKFMSLLDVFRKDGFVIPEGLEDNAYAYMIETVLPVLIPLNGSKDLFHVFQQMIMVETKAAFEGTNLLDYWNHSDVETYLLYPNARQVTNWKNCVIYKMAKIIMIESFRNLWKSNNDHISGFTDYVSRMTSVYAVLPKFCCGYNRPQKKRKSRKLVPFSYVEHYRLLMGDLLTVDPDLD